MSIPNQLTLSPSVWNDFTYRLNHRDELTSERIDALFKSIDDDFAITEIGNSIVVESELIDEDAILSALFPNQCMSMSEKTSHNYTIHIESSVNMEDLYTSLLNYMDQFSNDDFYSSRLLHNDFGNSIYTEIQSNGTPPIAA